MQGVFHRSSELALEALSLGGAWVSTLKVFQHIFFCDFALYLCGNLLCRLAFGGYVGNRTVTQRLAFEGYVGYRTMPEREESSDIYSSRLGPILIAYS